MSAENDVSKNVKNLSCEDLIKIYKELSGVYIHDRSTTDEQKKDGLETGEPPYYGADEHPDFNRQVRDIENELKERCGNGETDISKILGKHGLTKIEIR